MSVSNISTDKTLAIYRIAFSFDSPRAINRFSVRFVSGGSLSRIWFSIASTIASPASWPPSVSALTIGFRFFMTLENLAFELTGARDDIPAATRRPAFPRPIE